MIFFDEKWLESSRFIRPKTLKIKKIYHSNVKLHNDFFLFKFVRYFIFQ